MTRFGLMAVRRDDTYFVAFPRATKLLTLFWVNNLCLVIRKKRKSSKESLNIEILRKSIPQTRVEQR